MLSTSETTELIPQVPIQPIDVSLVKSSKNWFKNEHALQSITINNCIFPCVPPIHSDNISKYSGEMVVNIYRNCQVVLFPWRAIDQEEVGGKVEYLLLVHS